MPARRRPISLSAIHQIVEEMASLDWGNIMGQGSSSTFQRTRIRAAFDRTCAQREVFYACVVNRIKVNSGSWLGKKIFDIASHALSDIAWSDAIAVQRRFFPRALVVRQSARPARRRARRNSRRAREKSAAN